MSKTIESVPEFLTREQYLGLFKAVGFDPHHIIELRMAPDGVHALVIALDEHGERIFRKDGSGAYEKHRVFIPVRDDASDTRVARVTEVAQ